MFTEIFKMIKGLFIVADDIEYLQLEGIPNKGKLTEEQQMIRDIADKVLEYLKSLDALDCDSVNYSWDEGAGWWGELRIPNCDNVKIGYYSFPGDYSAYLNIAKGAYIIPITWQSRGFVIDKLKRTFKEWQRIKDHRALVSVYNCIKSTEVSND